MSIISTSPNQYDAQHLLNLPLDELVKECDRQIEQTNDLVLDTAEQIMLQDEEVYQMELETTVMEGRAARIKRDTKKNKSFLEIILTIVRSVFDLFKLVFGRVLYLIKMTRIPIRDLPAACLNIRNLGTSIINSIGETLYNYVRLGI